MTSYPFSLFSSPPSLVNLFSLVFCPSFANVHLESEVKKQQKNLKSDMKEVELGHQDVVTNLKQEHDKNITRLRQDHERSLKEMQQKYDKKMKNLREDLELRRKNEIHEVEGMKLIHSLFSFPSFSLVRSSPFLILCPPCD